MTFVSILRTPESDELRIVASEERILPERYVTDEGVFAEALDLVVYEREVPSADALLEQVREVLASSRVEGSHDTFVCPVPIAMRAIEVAATYLWPTRRMQCSDCQLTFTIPYTERKRMYLTCPRCHNALLNPAWDSL